MSLRQTSPMSAAGIASLGRTDLIARVAELEADVERLEAHMEALRAETLGAAIVTPVSWGLTYMEGRVFGVLMARELCSKDAIYLALYSDRPQDSPSPKSVDVFVCKLRSKVEPKGILIENRWGLGWFMTPATKAMARNLIAEPEAAAA